jgi:hypothetical protein
MVLVAGGGYAEYVAAHMGCVMKIPEGISMTDAAGLCLRLFIFKRKVIFCRYSGNIFNCISRFTIDWKYEKR